MTEDVVWYWAVQMAASRGARYPDVVPSTLLCTRPYMLTYCHTAHCPALENYVQNPRTRGHTLHRLRFCSELPLATWVTLAFVNSPHPFPFMVIENLLGFFFFFNYGVFCSSGSPSDHYVV